MNARRNRPGFLAQLARLWRSPVEAPKSDRRESYPSLRRVREKLIHFMSRARQNWPLLGLQQLQSASGIVPTSSTDVSLIFGWGATAGHLFTGFLSKRCAAEQRMVDQCFSHFAPRHHLTFRGRRKSHAELSYPRRQQRSTDS